MQTKLVTYVSLISAIAGAAYFVDDRYASGPAFQEQLMNNYHYHLEQEIFRAQDKMQGLLLIPKDERRGWQHKEIIRLDNLINRLIRSRRGGAEVRLGRP
jgi:hypothetical protein